MSNSIKANDKENKTDVKQLKSMLVSLIKSNNKLSNTNDIFSTIQLCLIQNIHAKQLDTDSFKEITSLLLQITSRELKENSSDILCSIQLLEKVMFLFFFHYDSSIIHLGLLIEKFLVGVLPNHYSGELIQTFIQIIQIALIKRTANGITSSVIIANISSALMLLIQITPNRNTKIFYDFIKQNYNEYELLYSFSQLSNDELNFSTIFSNDHLFDLLDRFKGEFDKKLKMIQSYIDKSEDTTISTMNQIQQIIDKMSQLCKVIDSLIIRGHRSYNIDKTIKNIIPKARNFLSYLIKPITLDISLSVVTINNIIHCFKVLDAYDISSLLLLLNWNRELLKKHHKYISNTELIIVIISEAISLPNDSVDQIIEMICQIIDNFIKAYGLIVEENIWVRVSLARILLCLEKIKPVFAINKEKYSSALKFNEDIQKDNNKGNNETKDYRKENVEYYSSVYDDSMNKANGVVKKYDADYMTNAIGKFEEFKNSMKKIYNVTSSLEIDILVSAFKSNIQKNDVSIEDFEKFFIESSIEMYREIFKPHY